MTGELSEICSEPLPVPRSLWHLFVEGVGRNPDRRAIAALHQAQETLVELQDNKTRSESPWLSWTWAELQTAVLRVASGLVKNGAERGSTLLTLLPNGIEREVVLWASVALQMTHVPLDAGLVAPGRRDELKYYLSTARPRGVIVVKDEEGTKAVDALLGRETNVVRLTVGVTAPEGWQSFEEVASKTAIRDLRTTDFMPDPALENDQQRVALILFTSGTSTGRPKGCPITVQNMLHTAVHRGFVMAGPTSWIVHSACFRAIANYAAFQSAHSGAEMILPNATFSPESTLSAIEKCNAEGLHCVPFQIHLFSVDPSIKTRRLESLKNLTLGGDMITADIIAKAKSCFPSAQVFPGHGMTEGSGVIGFSGKARGLPQPQFESIMSVGVPSPGTNIRICDEQRRPVARGQPGDLFLGGPGMIRRYLDNAQPEAFYSDHIGDWLHTGDRAFIDEAGYVYLLGRSKDIIKKKAMSLSPAVIASTLNKQPGIQSTVFGIPHPVYGEIVVVVVQDRELAHDPEKIKAIVQDNLGMDYAVDKVFMLSELGFKEFPLNPSGKIMNLTLKEAVLKFDSRH